MWRYLDCHALSDAANMATQHVYPTWIHPFSIHLILLKDAIRSHNALGKRRLNSRLLAVADSPHLFVCWHADTEKKCKLAKNGGRSERGRANSFNNSAFICVNSFSWSRHGSLLVNRRATVIQFVLYDGIRGVFFYTDWFLCAMLDHLLHISLIVNDSVECFRLIFTL